MFARTGQAASCPGSLVAAPVIQPESTGPTPLALQKGAPHSGSWGLSLSVFLVGIHPLVLHLRFLGLFTQDPYSDPPLHPKRQNTCVGLSFL